MFLSQPWHILPILCVCSGAAELQKKVNSYNAKTNQGIHPPGFKEHLSGFDHNPHYSLNLWSKTCPWERNATDELICKKLKKWDHGTSWRNGIMKEVQARISWKKLKKWVMERSWRSGVIDETEEVGSWKKLKKGDHGRSWRSGVMDKAWRVASWKKWDHGRSSRTEMEETV